MWFFKSWVVTLGFGYALVFDFDAPDTYQLAIDGTIATYNRISWVLFKRV